MWSEIYESASDETAAMMLTTALREMNGDERDRRRGLPPEVSRRMVSELRAALGLAQEEAERLLLGAEDDADKGRFDGRVWRRYERDGVSMSFATARNILCSVACGAFIRQRPEWLELVDEWRFQLDILEAAQETLKVEGRRKAEADASSTLATFRQILVLSARREDTCNLAKLQNFIKPTQARPARARLGTNLAH